MALVDGGNLVIRAITQRGVDTIRGALAARTIANSENRRISNLENIVILTAFFTKRTPSFAQQTHRFAQKEAHSWPW